MGTMTDKALANIERHARRTDLDPEWWMDTCELLEHRLRLAIEVDARTPEVAETHECSGWVSDRTSWNYRLAQPTGYRPCRRNATRFEDGLWWCGVHAPSKTREGN